MTDRGQAFALEAVISVVVIVMALVLAMQVVQIAPWSGDADHELSNLEAQGDQLLLSAHEEGAITEFATCVAYNEDENPVGEPVQINPSAEDPIMFETMLNEIVSGQAQVAVELEYPTSSGQTSEYITPVGPPERSYTAAATMPVALYNADQRLGGATCVDTDSQLEDVDMSNDEFYFEDQHPGRNLYGVVTVRVVLW